jgi:hypothetical protein
MAFADSHTDSSLAHLLGELKDDITGLVRQEMALARREAAAKTGFVRKSAVLLGGGALVGVFSIFYLALFLNGFLAAGLALLNVSPAVSAWVAPLAVGIVLGLAAWTLALIGLRSLHEANPRPDSWRTVRSLRAFRSLYRRQPAGKG